MDAYIESLNAGSDCAEGASTKLNAFVVLQKLLPKFPFNQEVLTLYWTDSSKLELVKKLLTANWHLGHPFAITFRVETPELEDLLKSDPLLVAAKKHKYHATYQPKAATLFMIHVAGSITDPMMLDLLSQGPLWNASLKCT